MDRKEKTVPRPRLRKPLHCTDLRDARIDDPFWNGCVRLVTGELLPYQYNILWDRIPGAPPGRSVRNLRIAARLEQGRYEGCVCQDAELAQWLEAAAYSLAALPDPKLRSAAEEMIDLILLARQPDGYLNSYITVLRPGKRFCGLKEGRELCTAGHFIEAAVAWHQATGEDRLLKAMCRFADLICQVFRTPDRAGEASGQGEIGLALYRLYEATGEERYRTMARDFIDRRGAADDQSRESTLSGFTDAGRGTEPCLPTYTQAHAPVREQTTAGDDPVRVLDLCSAMADLAGSCGDESLLRACDGLYESVIRRRICNTGGASDRERSDTDFDPPDSAAYAESRACAALAQFCKRMTRITGDARYMDTAELAIYNTVLAGISADGRSFFHVEPPEADPDAGLPDTERAYVLPVRQKWFGRACCPPDIARLLASLGGFVLFRGEDSLYLNLLIGGTFRAELSGTPVEIAVESALPWEGRARIRVRSERPLEGSLRIRVPSYAEDPVFTGPQGALELETDRGYAVLPLQGTRTEAVLTFGMTAWVVHDDPRVQADPRKVAVRKGPLVYCLEEADNGPGLPALRLDLTKPMKEVPGGSLRDCVDLEAEGLRLRWSGELYNTRAPDAA